MTTVNLIKARSVLDFNWVSTSRATFSSKDEDTGEVLRTAMFSIQDYEDMGRPDKLTVTIEPGDLLNTGKAGATVAHPAPLDKIRASLLYTLERAENEDFDIGCTEDIVEEIIEQLKDDDIILAEQLMTFDEQTLAKVYDALLVDLDREQAIDMVNRMQNAGLFFRERATESLESSESSESAIESIEAPR